jgi:hypothetical protein
MRLTNEMRGDFANRVVSKIPLRSNWTREKIIAEIEKRLLTTWPKEVIDFRKKYPAQINNTTMIIDWLTYRNPEGRFYYGYVNCLNGSDLRKIDYTDLKQHYDELCAEIVEREQIRCRIYEQACSCNTLAQLRVVFPELLGLMPKEAVTVKSLPVAAKGLTSELVKLGLEIPQ